MMTPDETLPTNDGEETASDQSTVEVQHGAGSAEVEVESDLPDEAFRMLFEFDPKPESSSRYRFDRLGRRWVERP